MGRPPPTATYAACRDCTAKFFCVVAPEHCPRCGGGLLALVTAAPPWLGDSHAARGETEGRITPRHDARYDLRAAPDA
ncbi:hypothetical protein K2D_18520 [Planctomycetes bacterium K2D]|uniref:Uncharacterized protein n=1 Tax=Botrimarina mediterranea TaxID=2528022 RepID=A0A518K790_9BACT|nr:hypothetical protein Spa11_18540 [Botrimarina mediterranea]QDV78245.1 hypothetical protein K2D_18520 [Planctomycetes bacterium K2D]